MSSSFDLFNSLTSNNNILVCGGGVTEINEIDHSQNINSKNTKTVTFSKTILLHRVFSPEEYDRAYKDVDYTASVIPSNTGAISLDLSNSSNRQFVTARKVSSLCPFDNGSNGIVLRELPSFSSMIEGAGATINSQQLNRNQLCVGEVKEDQGYDDPDSMTMAVKRRKVGTSSPSQSNITTVSEVVKRYQELKKTKELETKQKINKNKKIKKELDLLFLNEFFQYPILAGVENAAVKLSDTQIGITLFKSLINDNKEIEELLINSDSLNQELLVNNEGSVAHLLAMEMCGLQLLAANDYYFANMITSEALNRRSAARRHDTPENQFALCFDLAKTEDGKRILAANNYRLARMITPENLNHRYRIFGAEKSLIQRLTDSGIGSEILRQIVDENSNMEVINEGDPR